jgi:small basic protein (TIGR04137 family)
MTIHNSLAVKGKLKRARSVYTRAERIERLKAERRFEDGDSVFGLPKVAPPTRMKGGGKKKKKKEEEAAAAETKAEE